MSELASRVPDAADGVRPHGGQWDSGESALALYEEAMGYTYAAALRAAAVLGVADHMDREPRPVVELARATGTAPDGLHRVLRMLAARGIVRGDGDSRFALTAKGAALRSDAPLSARAGILMFTDRMFWTMTHEVASAVRTEPSSFAEVFGVSLGEYFERNAEAEALYYEGMETVSEAEHPILVRSYGLPASGTVVDVGGGRGGFLLAVLRQRPGLHGILLDRAEVVRRHRIAGDEVAGRWEAVAGDFLADVPPGDIYLLKRIIHNWDDERSVRILGNCRRAMALDGRVAVIDAVVPEGAEAHQSRPMDFMMLAARTGRERTAAQLEALFTAAGLRVTRVIHTPSVMSIVEGAAA